MIKKILCKFATILTLFWAASIILSSNIINQINSALSSDIVRILFAGGLIALGFWLSNKCTEDGCKSG